MKTQWQEDSAPYWAPKQGNGSVGKCKKTGKAVHSCNSITGSGLGLWRQPVTSLGKNKAEKQLRKTPKVELWLPPAYTLEPAFKCPLTCTYTQTHAIYLFVCLFIEAGLFCLTVLDILELPLQTTLTSNSQRSVCLCLSSAEITDMCHCRPKFLHGLTVKFPGHG